MYTPCMVLGGYSYRLQWFTTVAGPELYTILSTCKQKSLGTTLNTREISARPPVYLRCHRASFGFLYTSHTNRSPGLRRWWSNARWRCAPPARPCTPLHSPAQCRLHSPAIIPAFPWIPLRPPAYCTRACRCGYTDTCVLRMLWQTC